MNIVHTLSSTRLAWKIGALFALLLAVLAFYPPPPILAQSPPETPSSVAVTRADGTLTASGYTVANATKYHITYSSDGGASWSLAVLAHTESTITISADNAKTYIIGVRAGNDNGWSGWRNSPSIGPFTPLSPPATPSTVSVTRADGTLTASGYAVSNADTYHITYTDDGGASWSLAALDHTAATITISVDNAKTYIVGVRAKNSAGGSAWRNSASAGPFNPDPTPTPTPAPVQPPATPASVTVTRADGTLTASGYSVSGATKYHITYTDNNAQSWQLAALDHTKDTITFDVDNAKTYIVGVRAKNDAGGSNWRNSPSAGPYTPPPNLTVTDPTPNSAALTMDNYSGEWYYSTSENSGGGSGAGRMSIAEGAGIASVQSVTCNGPVNGAEATVTGLDPNTNYTITAYGNGNCGGAEIASATAQTLNSITLHPSAETTDGATLTIMGYTGNWWYEQTSPPHSSVCAPASGATATITGLLPGRAYTYAAYGNEKCHPSNNTLAIATFTTQYALRVDGLTENSATLVIEGSFVIEEGSDKLKNWWYKRTAPSGDDTCYAVGYAQKSVALSLTPGQSYTYTAYVDSACAAPVGSVSFKTPGLDGNADTNANTLTITIVNWTKADGTTTAAWWYQQTAPTTGTCTSVAEGTASVTLSGFTFDHTNRNQYVFKAYSAMGCDAADAIARKHLFPAYSSRGGVENVTATTATILAYNTGTDSAWGYKSTETGATCVGPFDGVGSEGVASAPVTGLTPGTTYTFQMYMSAQNAPCSARFDSDVTFTTAPAGVSNLGQRQVGSTMPVGRSANHRLASSFTTGTGADSFTLERVTLLFGGSGIGMPAPEYDLNVRLFSAGSDGNPGTAVANATLSGPARPAENSTGIYTCAGSGCALAPDTDYYVVLSVPVPQCRTVEGVQDCSGTTGRAYYWQRSGTNNETASPADSGFSIANETRHTHDGGSTWTRLTRVVMFGVDYAMPAPTLTASDVATTTATLTLANEGGESAWYAKQVSPSEGTCSAAIASGASLGLTGLQSGREYTYAAYRDANCTQVVASGTFASLYPLAASNVTDTTATLTLSANRTWYAKYTTPSGGTCSSAVSGALDLDNLARSTSYTYEAYSDSACTTVIGRTSFTTGANWIAVSDITATSATLTLTGHTGSWWVKRTSPTPAGSCEAGEADFSHAVSSLTSSRTYTYTAYSDSGCATAIRSASFTTAVTVSNLGASGSGSYKVGHFQQPSVAAQGFNTGSNTSGYTLSSVTIRVNGKTGSPGSFAVKLHSASGVNIGPALATLSGSDPTGNGNYTYTCTPSSSDNCSLSRNTTYYIWLSAPNAPGGSHYYDIARTGSTGETRVPSDNGWSLADNGRHRPGNVWNTNVIPLKLGVAAPPGPSFVASDITATTATLTLTGKGGGWWLKRTTPAGGTCAAGEGDYTHALSSLNPGTAYTFKAYGDSACATTALHSVNFTTPAGLTASAVTDTSATLTIAGLSSGTDWWLKETEPNTGTCTVGESDFSHALSSLSAGTSYTYKAYSDSACSAANELASETFATSASLTASGVSDTAATLTLASATHTTNWSLKETAPNTGTCANQTSAAATLTLAEGTTYTYKAYSGSGCTSANEIASETFTTHSLTASAITPTTATLTLAVSGLSGAWYYKANTGPDSACQTVSSGTTDTLTGLTADTVYAYTAHSASNCAAAMATEYFSTTDFGVGNLAETAAPHSCDAGYFVPQDRKCAIAFTTGNRASGYTLQSVSAHFADKSGSPSNIIVAIHAADTTNSSNPAASAKVTLSGSNPDTAGLYTFTCSGSGCNLAANTTYFVVMSTPDTAGVKDYRLRTTSSDDEARHPTANGWSIGNAGRYKTGANPWADLSNSRTGLLHIAVNDGPGVSNLSETSTQGSPSTSGGAWLANAFTTGSNTNGYTVVGATVPISPGGGGSNVTLRIFTNNSHAGNTPGTLLATLTNTGDTAGSYTFSCSGSGCDLAASTSYFLVLSSTSGWTYRWASTASDNDTGGGWSIGNVYKASLDSGTSWANDVNGNATKFAIAAIEK